MRDGEPVPADDAAVGWYRTASSARAGNRVRIPVTGAVVPAVDVGLGNQRRAVVDDRGYRRAAGHLLGPADRRVTQLHRELGDGRVASPVRDVPGLLVF